MGGFMTKILIDKYTVKLALEALENGKRVRNAEGGTQYQPDLEDKAITAIKQSLAAPVQERNFCERCGKRLGGDGDIHTCTPPAAQQKANADHAVKCATEAITDPDGPIKAVREYYGTAQPAPVQGAE
jgi:hypothetical protein